MNSIIHIGLATAIFFNVLAVSYLLRSLRFTNKCNDSVLSHWCDLENRLQAVERTRREGRET